MKEKSDLAIELQKCITAIAGNKIDDIKNCSCQFTDVQKSYLLILAVSQNRVEILDELIKIKKFPTLGLEQWLSGFKTTLPDTTLSVRDSKDVLYDALKERNTKLLLALKPFFNQPKINFPYYIKNDVTSQQDFMEYRNRQLALMAVELDDPVMLEFLKKELLNNLVLEPYNYDHYDEQCIYIPYIYHNPYNDQDEDAQRHTLIPPEDVKSSKCTLLHAACRGSLNALQWLLTHGNFGEGRKDPTSAMCSNLAYLDKMAASRKELRDCLETRWKHETSVLSDAELIYVSGKYKERLGQLALVAMGRPIGVFRNLINHIYKDYWEDLFYANPNDPDISKILNFYSDNIAYNGENSKYDVFAKIIKFRPLLSKIKLQEPLSEADISTINKKHLTKAHSTKLSPFKRALMRLICEHDDVELFQKLLPNNNHELFRIAALTDAISILKHMLGNDPAKTFIRNQSEWEELKKLSNDGMHPNLKNYMSQYVTNPWVGKSSSMLAQSFFPKYITEVLTLADGSVVRAIVIPPSDEDTVSDRRANSKGLP